MHDINNIIESLLFAAEEPLTLDRLKNILETVESKEIKSALQALSDNYEARGGGFKLFEVAGGWQLRSRPEYNQWIKRMLQPSPQRLSRPALETLAIVAYNQPIIRADIEHIRGVDCGGVLRQLMERKLIRVLGRKEIPGRPLIYATTKLFLELFGLKDLKDLPSPKEIEEMASAMEQANAELAAETDEVRGAAGFEAFESLPDTWAQGRAGNSIAATLGIRNPVRYASPIQSQAVVPEAFWCTNQPGLNLTPTPWIGLCPINVGTPRPRITPGGKSKIRFLPMPVRGTKNP